MKKYLVIATAAFVGFGFGFSDKAQAQKWGDLTMTVVLDGDAPVATEVNANADPFCTKNKILTENLVVNPKTKGIANLVFMIDGRKTKLETKQLHPDLQKIPETKPVLDNLKCMFIPRVLAVRAGQSILVTNSDETGHNAKFSFFENDEVNPMIPVNGSKDVLTKIEEKAPTKVECSIHGWMSAYVIVANHPYVGISDAYGKISIPKLPAGVELDFRIWHESQDKSIEEVTLAGKSQSWKKGSVKMTLKEGANDLGTLLIKPDRFKK